ncbi:non-ribosomal peptide synthetase [Sphaerotilus sp.]|uniref:non-ribosomal peptide synthetase n=1 Tax=Sphaerotilus sp. TaxID=2093942 RepID=UPI00286E852C|nr:non-ribosomal peptide synthetase [Sphaerotilus sp.]
MCPTIATTASQAFPLTSPQREIWFDQMLHSHVPLYNIGGYFEINRAVDARLFAQAVQRLVAGHDALRTVLRAVPGSELPEQTYPGAPAVDVSLPVLDFSEEDSPEQAAACWMQAQFIAPFTLHDQRLFRFALIRLQENQYKFFFVYHHLITDGWGISLLNRRLGAIYGAMLQDGGEYRPNDWHFPEYQAFIENDQHYTRSARFADDLRYWADKYQTLPEPLFRKSTSRTADRKVLSERQVLWLGRTFYNRVIAFAKDTGATPFNVMLSALYVYFTRTARRDELAVGLPILNRGGAAFKDTVGLFINMIPSRFSFGTGLSFRELLQAVGRTLKSDYRHQKLPIGELYRAMDFHKSGQRNLIDLQFNYAKHDHDTESGVFQGNTIALTNDSKQSPLIISVWEFHDDDEVQVDFVYNLAYLDTAEAKRIQSGFLQVLAHVLDDADSAVSTIPLLSQAEQLQLAAWNQNPATSTTPAAPPATLVELFEAQAAQHPDRTAVVYDGQPLSYADLNQQANRLAHALIGLGVVPDTLVGLCTARSLEMVVGLLAILKAGGAYVPLDPDYPPERLAFMLEDSAVKVLLTQSALLKSLPDHAATTVCLDSDQATIASFPAHNPAVRLQPDHLAYVIYTSGSTGKPKGCLVTHANVTRLFAVSEPLYHFGADDTWTLFHSYAFDFSVWELWGALLYGGKLVVVPYLTSRDPAAFYQLLITQQVTVLNQTPSAFRQLIQVDRQPDQLALRHVIFGGEALDCAALQPWFAQHGTRQPQLTNMYGITETTVHVTYCPLTGDETESGNIGRPLADLQVWILDAHQQPVPIGVAGEMFVGGAGVSRGYLNRPELTDSRFIETTLLGQTHRLYKTGDLARQLPDGSLEYLGRIDQQVKIRGFRIELGEIETLLTQHPAVQESVVQAHGQGDNTRLVAYLTLAQPLADAEHGLRVWLAGRLPDYMLPSAFIVLERFPLTVNGKIDHKALPAPDAVERTGFVAPHTPAECLIAGLWQKTLGVEQVGVHDDFFAIGGNSLNGIRFINELNATTQEIFHIYDLFAAPTLGQFVEGMRAHYPNLMARLDGTASAATAEQTARDRLADGDWAQLQQLLPKQQFRPRRSTRKNPPAVFILAPPRSGTTLLRVMLGGHPGLFAPPELELLGFNDLRERAQRCAEHDTFWLQGTVRALMELHGCSADEAWQRMAQFEAQDLDTGDFYRVLQDAAPGRLLVDKTPFYSVSADILRQAEALFDGALYIHLQRHPLGMIRSFENARMERISAGHPYAAPLAALAESGSSTRMAELLWWQCNQNIVDFLATIPAERQHRVKFEELTAQPRTTVQAMCDFLGLPVDGAMLDPYQDKKQRMTDGVHAEGHMLGDIKFHTHQKIDAQVAESWRDAYKEDFLSPDTWVLAERLGYARDLQGVTIPRLPAQQPRPLSYAQQRLWFLAQLEGQSATYNIPLALRLTGRLDQAALRQAFVTLIERHESLRATFPTVNGAASVRVGAPFDPLTLVEPPALPAAAQAQWLGRWLDEQVHRPFDLERGPLLRLHLLRTGPEDHVLLVNMHHIISDGWSMGVLVKEWSQLYSAAVQQTALQLPALSIQYGDYAAWQKNWLEQGVLAQQLAYWQEQLAGMPHLLELPTDFPRPAVMRHQGRHLKSHVSAALTDQLRRISQDHGATLFMTVLSAFNVLLHRYSQQTDLAVGTPIANRHQHQTEGVVGFFVNTLVLRSRIDPEQGFLDLLRQVRQTALEGYRHQDVPFELLVERLNPARSMSHSPLFQVMFMLQSMQQPALAGLEMAVLQPDYQVAKFDLTLTASEQADGLACTWEYDSDLFHADTVAALARHFEVLLQGLCADPTQAVGRLPLLTPDEVQRLIATRPTGFQNEGTERTVIVQFEAQVTTHPDKVAVVYDDQHLTYDGLNQRANQLAGYLMELGVGPDTLVGLCVERSLDMLVGLLGILKAGAAYLPLDPDQPQERLRFILEDAAVPVLLTQAHLQDRLPSDSGLRVVALDKDWEQIQRYAPQNVPTCTAPHHLAYVIYTSGSTGQPKGCLVTHANMSRLFTETDHWYHFDARDVWTLFHSCAFDFSVWEIWGALLHGGKLVVVPYLTSRDPEAFYQLLIDQQVTVLNQTPSAFRQLIGVDTQPERLALREVIFGGEALDRAILAPWVAQHGETRPRLVNMYGITETTVHVTYCPLGGTQGDAQPMAGDIGVPIPDLQVWILDALQQPLPDGVPGEMYVGGAGVTRGYLNRPALTAARFVELDLFGRIERLYRTGDLARRLPDGSLDYLGRIDHQVKLRGFRIELGEIEAVLNQHDAVQEAVVLLDDAMGQARLLAYVVPTVQAEAAERSDHLRQWLKSRLPDYMVPTGFQFLDVLPLTGNGKIDRRALAALGVDTAERRPTEPPSTVEEQRLVALWAEVLRLPPEQIGAHDNFFHLGGHSLLATQLISRIRTAFAIELPLRQLFERPTVSELSRLIGDMSPSTTDLMEMEEGEL